MATGLLAFQVVARHGYAIDRLRRDMLAEERRDELVQFLAYDAANFIYGFLLASGNNVTAGDRRLRDELRDAILTVLGRNGIDRSSFAVRPDIEPQCES